MPRHGTWTETGGGDGWKALAILAAVLLIGGSGAALAGTAEAILAAAAVIVAVAIFAGGPLLAWWMLRVRPARDARAAQARAALALAYEQEKRAVAAERHQRALEIARASAPVIALDPAAIAAAVAGARPQPVKVIRAEVER